MRSSAAVAGSSSARRLDLFAPGKQKTGRPRWVEVLLNEARWWVHRRRQQWKQVVAAALVVAGSISLWLFLVEEVLE